MFPLIRAKAKWDFEGIAGERVGGVVAHDMVRGKEGLREERGVFI